jgi:hypothetical protein
MVHVSHPEGTLRHIALGIGTLFGIMGIMMLGLRVRMCAADECLMTRTVLIAQTTSKHQTFVGTLLVFTIGLAVIADCIADVLLSALPIWSMRNINLGQKRKLLISSTFSASMVINIVTVTQAVAFFQSITSGSIIFEHVKVACSLIVCNLLVIVTFVYRILHKGKTGIEDSIPERSNIVFTTVDLAHGGFSQETSKEKSLSVPTTKSSAWSFGGGGGSKTSGSVAGTMSQIDTTSAVRSEDEHSDWSVS